MLEHVRALAPLKHRLANLAPVLVVAHDVEAMGAADEGTNCEGDGGADGGEDGGGDQRGEHRREEGPARGGHAQDTQQVELRRGRHHRHLSSVGATDAASEEQGGEQRPELDGEDGADRERVQLLLGLRLVSLHDPVHQAKDHRQRRVALQVLLEEPRDDGDDVDPAQHVRQEHRHGGARRAKGAHDQRERVEEVVEQPAAAARGKGQPREVGRAPLCPKVFGARALEVQLARGLQHGGERFHVRHQHHCHLVAHCDGLDQLHHLQRHGRVEAHEGLIEDHQPLALREDLGECRAAEHAAGELAGHLRAIGLIAQPNGRQCVADCRRWVRLASGAQRQRQVLGQVERVDEHALLEEEADALRNWNRRIPHRFELGARNLRQARDLHADGCLA